MQKKSSCNIPVVENILFGSSIIDIDCSSNNGTILFLKRWIEKSGKIYLKIIRKKKGYNAKQGVKFKIQWVEKNRNVFTNLKISFMGLDTV